MIVREIFKFNILNLKAYYYFLFKCITIIDCCCIVLQNHSTIHKFHKIYWGENVKSINIDVIHYNRKKERINIQSKENRKKIAGIVFKVINQKAGL